MNYFAHAFRFLDDPYFVAGTALPDWLSVVDRKVRVHTKKAAPRINDFDPRIAALARGIVQHHADDRWFHGVGAFLELSTDFSRRIRAAVAPDETPRPGFLGHILVEMLLDATLIERHPARIEAYYDVVAELDAGLIEAAVGEMAGKSAAPLARFIPLFHAERFLPDYVDDDKLCLRLNQVLRRVGLPRLPDEFRHVLPEARRQVNARAEELLPPPLA